MYTLNNYGFVYRELALKVKIHEYRYVLQIS